jgi:acetylglutamate kinase
MGRPRVVYKIGGPALEDPALVKPLAEEVRRAQKEADVVLVHGGGRQIEKLLKQLAIEAKFVDGRRVTSPEAMDAVEMVLSGTMNKGLAAGLSNAGLPAIGISGRDGCLIRADLVPDLGRVGTPAKVDPAIIESLWAANLVPVISPVSNGPSGEATNINADEAAQWIARALGARTLVFLSDVDGVLLDGSSVEHLDSATIERRTNDGAIHGGMAMKVRMALDAARSGIPSVVIAGRARLSGGFSGTRVSVN